MKAFLTHLAVAVLGATLLELLLLCCGVSALRARGFGGAFNGIVFGRWLWLYFLREKAGAVSVGETTPREEKT